MAGRLSNSSLEQAMLDIEQAMLERGRADIALNPTRMFIPAGFTFYKHYKVVKHPTKPYVRNYKRQVKGGLSLIDAVFACIYAQPEFNQLYPDLFTKE
jgi:hypothetical protein